MRRGIILSVLVVFMIAFIVIAGCNDRSTPSPAPTTKTPTITPTPTKTPQTVDLQIVQVSLEQRNDGNYNLIGTLRNNGPGTAQGVFAHCCYTCLPGDQIPSGCMDIINNGVLGGNQEKTYTNLAARLACTIQLSNVNLECVVDEDNTITETNEKNNVFYATLNV